LLGERDRDALFLHYEYLGKVRVIRMDLGLVREALRRVPL